MHILGQDGDVRSILHRKKKFIKMQKTSEKHYNKQQNHLILSKFNVFHTCFEIDVAAGGANGTAAGAPAPDGKAAAPAALFELMMD